jgi:hypothetical protein
MPGDTCATCRLDRQAEEDLQAEQDNPVLLFGAVDNSRLDNAERDHQPWVKQDYLGNWPGKKEEEQER